MDFFFFQLNINSPRLTIFSLLPQCLLSAKSLVLKHPANYYPMYSVTSGILSKTINFNRPSAHAPSWPLIRVTSSSYLDIMVYVGQDRMRGNSITARVPSVITNVRMASVSINVLRSTLLVSFFHWSYCPSEEIKHKLISKPITTTEKAFKYVSFSICNRVRLHESLFSFYRTPSETGCLGMFCGKETKIATTQHQVREFC